MAAKASTFQEINSAIQNGQFSPVYLLMGEETYFIDALMDALEENVVAPEDRDFNLQTFFGTDADLDVVIAAAMQYPVMAERHMVLLKEAQALDKAKQQLDKLASYVNKPNPSCVFALSFKGDSLNATSQLMKAASKSENVVVFKSPKLWESQLAAPIRSYVASRRLSIDDKAIEMLKEFAGANLAQIFGEIDKLAITLPKGAGRIDANMVEKLIGVSKEYNFFELTDAVRNRNFAKAMRIADHYAQNPNKNSAIPVFTTLFNFFTKVAIANFSQKQGQAEVMKLCEVKSQKQERDLLDAMRNYPGMKPVHAISAIREADCRAKGIDSVWKEHDILKELIYRIFTL